MADPAPTLSLRTRIAWAIGSLPMSMTMFVVNTYFLRFATDFVGIAAAAAGGILVLTKVFDLAASPLIGVVSDHTKTPMGRRRPFLLAGAAITVASLLLMFWAPTTLGAHAGTYMVMTFAVLALGFACYMVPYIAMPAEMTQSPSERAELITYRVYALSAAQFIAGGLAPILVSQFGGERDAFGYMSLSIGAIILLFGVICFFGTAGAPSTALSARSRGQYWSALPSIVRNRHYLGVVLTKALLLMGSNAHTATAAFYVRYVIGTSDTVLAWFLLAHSLGMAASQLIWLPLAKRFGKVAVYLTGASIYAGVSFAWAQLDSALPTALFIVFSALNGIGAGGALLATESMLPDAIAADHARSGLHREGTLTAVATFAEKIGYTVGIATVGIILSAFPIDKSAVAIDPAATRGVLLAFGVAPALFLIASMAMIYFVCGRHRQGSDAQAATNASSI